MKWQKLGQIFSPEAFIGETSSRPTWMKTHAAVPIAEHVSADTYRIYFSARDIANRSTTGSVIVDLSNPTQILDLSQEPVLAPGELGAFDDSGAMATWLTSAGDGKYLYYVGWNLGITVPFRNAIGVARKGDDGKFERIFPGPIVDRTPSEPHFCASCAVLQDGDMWRMWYLACSDWRLVGNQPQHRYHIRYSESKDGLNWHREGHVAIDYSDPTEYAISRPSVLRDEEGWHMWYSYRGERYRIGYATSVDGKNWERRDAEVGIEASAAGWDSDMIEYPFVFDHKGERFMLYNGNDFGRTGFGLAVLERP